MNITKATGHLSGVADPLTEFFLSFFRLVPLGIQSHMLYKATIGEHKLKQAADAI